MFSLELSNQTKRKLNVVCLPICIGKRKSVFDIGNVQQQVRFVFVNPFCELETLSIDIRKPLTQSEFNLFKNFREYRQTCLQFYKT